jgi:hypothetical protein
VKRRLILAGAFVGVVAVVSAGAWMMARDDEQTRPGASGGIGGLPNTCPPWAPNLRMNVFGKKYCSAINSDGVNTGVWASNRWADYRRDYCPPRNIQRAYVTNINDCCPNWAPILRQSVHLICSRLDDDGSLFQYDDPDGIYRGLYTAPPAPPPPPPSP